MTMINQTDGSAVDSLGKVLVADDSGTMRRLLANLLMSAGYEVVQAEDGLEAIRQVYETGPDLIISDVMMPGMNGYQVCRLTKDDALTHDIPVIMLTAKDQKLDQFWGLKTGADVFMTKPFEPQELIEQVQKLIKDHRRTAKSIPLSRLQERKPKNDAEVVSRLNALLDKKLHETTIIAEIADLGASIEDFNEIIISMMRTVAKLVDFQVGALVVFEEDCPVVYFYLGQASSRKMMQDFYQRLLDEFQRLFPDQGEYVQLDSNLLGEPVTETPAGADGYGTRVESFVSVPMRSRGTATGILALASPDRGLFVESHHEVLTIIAREAALVIENAMLYSKVKSFGESRAQRLSTIYEVGSLMSSITDMRGLMDHIIKLATRVTEAEAGSLLLYDNERNELYFEIATGAVGKSLVGKRIGLGQGVAGTVALECKPVIVSPEIKSDMVDRSFDKKVGFKTMSMLAVPLRVKEKLIGVLEVVNKESRAGFNIDDQELLMTLGTQVAVAIANAQLYDEMGQLFVQMVQSLSSAIDAKDRYTHGHSHRVTEFSLAIAEELKLAGETKDTLQLSALLHDIGKLGIPEEILCKPSRLTKEEFEVIKTHPIIGTRIIEPIKPLQKILPGMRHHHERYDGRGYPDGLQGKEIPLFGRIIAVADTYDAMTSDRSYRKGLSADIALEEIQTCAGTQFDPMVVEAFFQMVTKGRINKKK